MRIQESGSKMSHFNKYQKMMIVLKYLEMKSLKKKNLFCF